LDSYGDTACSTPAVTATSSTLVYDPEVMERACRVNYNRGPAVAAYGTAANRASTITAIAAQAAQAASTITAVAAVAAVAAMTAAFTLTAFAFALTSTLTTITLIVSFIIIGNNKSFIAALTTCHENVAGVSSISAGSSASISASPASAAVTATSNIEGRTACRIPAVTAID
jgi:hypothetical protein